MKKIYILVPLILLVGFTFYYRNFAADLAQREAAEQAAEDARIAEEEAKKLAAEKSARLESEKKAAQREAEAAEKEAKKRAEWEAAGAKLAEETAGYKKQGDDYTKQINELELQLVELRRSKDDRTNEALALTEQVELARIAKRNAELEIQRLTDMVADRAAKSSMTQMPPPAATKAPSR
jgi:hypothetical protein